MKKLLIVSLALNILMITGFVAKRIYYTYGPGSAGYLDWRDITNRQTTSLHSTLKIDSTDVVFVGNSITLGFPVTEIFGSGYKNRGIGGNTTAQILNRIPEIAKGKPRKIFIEAGVNDIDMGLSTDSIYTNYVNILKEIQYISPHTYVYVQSVFPSSKEMNKNIVELNTMLKNYCDLNGVVYIDVYSKLLTGECLNKSFTEDGIHLNGNGYAVWIDQIKNFVH